MYEAETARGAEVDPAPRPVGHFGSNEQGLLDIGGNVWEWTDSCYLRHRFDPPTTLALAAAPLVIAGGILMVGP